MIDPSLLREQSDLVTRSLVARGADPAMVAAAIAADDARRQAISRFEALRAEQNTHGKFVAKASPDEKAQLVADAQKLAESVKSAQAELSDAEATAKEALWKLPNLVIDGVPEGGEENFVTIKTVGDTPAFDFEPRDHLDIAEQLGIIDMERGAKISGSRFYFLVGLGALLENALMQRAMTMAYYYWSSMRI